MAWRGPPRNHHRHLDRPPVMTLVVVIGKIRVPV
jgi:hypothetical protein